MIELIRNRRSIRKFVDKKVPYELQETLGEVLLRSPTSRNLCPWQFVFVDSPQLLEKLSAAKSSGSSFVKDAPLAVAICAEPDVSDVWIEDCSIAAILLQMAAQSFGLGSCWVQIRRRKTADALCSEQYVREQLNLPEKIRVECIIAIGYPAEQKPPVNDDQLPKNKLSKMGTVTYFN